MNTVLNDEAVTLGRLKFETLKPEDLGQTCRIAVAQALLRLSRPITEYTLENCGVRYPNDRNEFWLALHRARLIWPGITEEERSFSAGRLNELYEAQGMRLRAVKEGGRWFIVDGNI